MAYPVIILLATLKISLLVAICQCGPALKITFTYQYGDKT